MQKAHPRTSAFTLTELIIVIAIMAIIAALVIPKFSDANDRARAAATANDLRNVRDQINRYKFEHAETWPDLVANQWAPLLQTTDANGNLVAGGPFGPYLRKAPINAYTSAGTIAASEIAGNGYVYDNTTGFLSAVGFNEITQTYTAP